MKQISNVSISVSQHRWLHFGFARNEVVTALGIGRITIGIWHK